ncbi:hypothetical protein BDW69DRAFT_154485 [Aspergillus filifer]
MFVCLSYWITYVLDNNKKVILPFIPGCFLLNIPLFHLLYSIPFFFVFSLLDSDTGSNAVFQTVFPLLFDFSFSLDLNCKLKYIATTTTLT